MIFRNIYRFSPTDPANTHAMKTIRCFLWAGIMMVLLWFLYFSLSTIAIPYQIEYREGASQVMTQIFLAGGNPFSLENQPLGMNNYGIGYNLVAIPFAKLFGNTLMVYRGISLFFLLGSLLFTARTIFALKNDVLISVLGGVFIVVVLAGRGGLGAFPSAMGVFLFLAAVLIPFSYSFTYPSLIASAFLSVMAYYTKSYFVICFGVVAVYTFAFVSKKKGILYGLLFLFIFSLLFLGVRQGFKLYFIDTFIGNLSNTTRSQDHLRGQLFELVMEFYPSILLGLSLLFLSARRFLKSNPFRKGFLSRSNILHLDSPLFSLPINYFAFTFILCFLAFLFILGPHKWSYMTYAYQLVLPPYVLWLFQMSNFKSRFSMITICLLFGNVLILGSLFLNPFFLRQRDSLEWAILYAHIRGSNRIVNSPAIVSMVIDAGIMPVDSGQTEYYYNIKPYPANKLFGPGFETVRRNGIAYQWSIRNAVRHHKFDKVILTQGHRNLVPPDIVNQYYIKVETITLDMPQTHQTWVIEIWEPTGK